MRDSLLGVFEFIWSKCVDSREVVLRGDVVKLPDGLVLGERFTHLYAALPVYYDGDFKSVVVEDGKSVAIVWLIPIAADEARIVAEQGWEKFEQRLVERDPDLMDFARDLVS
ncbi:hypothetical protein Acsp01_17250 [Actinoplanes sp. NBRC 101535]|nr:hypothetical protein Acsp01_17250 [Actinoplanes sp. NBRC 101535]